MTPAAADAAPPTFVFTAYPGVTVHAGVIHDFPYPICGCDACDETAESSAAELERLVLAVAAGGYRENFPLGRKRLREFVLVQADGSGSRSGRGEAGTGAPERLQDAEERLARLPNGWQPWPARTH